MYPLVILKDYEQVANLIGVEVIIKSFPETPAGLLHITLIGRRRKRKLAMKVITEGRAFNIALQFKEKSRMMHRLQEAIRRWRSSST